MDSEIRRLITRLLLESKTELGVSFVARVQLRTRATAGAIWLYRSSHIADKSNFRKV